MSARDEFIATMVAEGVPADVAHAVLRDAATVKRLWIAEANAAYPYNIHCACTVEGCRCFKGPAMACSGCNKDLPTVTLKAGFLCAECRAFARIEKRLAPYHVRPEQSDLNLRLHVPSGKDEGIGGVNVPAEVRG